MKLTITTPLGIVLEAMDVASIRAEDPTGSFGIQRGHVLFVTVLRVGVDGGDLDRLLGVPAARIDGEIHIVLGDAEAVHHVPRLLDIRDVNHQRAKDLDALERDVLEGLRTRAAVDDASRASAQRLERAAIREVRRHLDPERSHLRPIGPFQEPGHDGD